jgi:iron complex outermembrane receptor protein
MNHKLWPFCSVQALAIAAACGGAVLGAPAFAQTPGASSSDEIIVTAQRREEAVLDVPIAVRSIGAAELERRNVDDVADIVSLTPSLRIDYRLSLIQPSIRGVGSIISVPGTGNNVAIYQDGFYMQSPLETDFALENIESIQVLKGPQGTLFGRNSTAGAILISTAQPDTETSGSIRARFGSFNSRSGQAYFTTGLFGGVAADIAAYYNAGDGDWTNIATGSEDDAHFEKIAIRMGLAGDITDALSWNFHYGWSDLEDNGVTLNSGYIFPSGGPPLVRRSPAFQTGTEPNTFSSVGPAAHTPRSDVQAESYQLGFEWDLGWAQLNTYSQYRRHQLDSWFDIDLTNSPEFISNTFNRESAWSHELILTSQSESPLQWTVGFFHFNDDVRYDPDAYFGAFAGSLQRSGFEVTSNAIFADVTYQLTERLYLTGGLRYSNDQVENAIFSYGTLNPPPVTVPVTPATLVYPDIDESQTSPRIVLRYEPDDDSSFYVSYAQGYKAPLPNIGSNPDPNLLPTPNQAIIDAEEMNSYEIGYKRHTSRYSFEAALYHYDYTNLQLSSSNAQNTVTLRNASDVVADGLEIDFHLNLTENFEVYISTSYVKAEYDNFANSAIWRQCVTAGVGGSSRSLNNSYGAPDAAVPCPTGVSANQFFQVAFNATGLQVIRTPELTGTIGATYTVPEFMGGMLEISGNLYHAGKNYFDLADQFPAESYELLSLRAQWTDPSERFHIAAFGDNVLDEEYITRINATGYGVGASWGPSAIFGIEIGAEF